MLWKSVKRNRKTKLTYSYLVKNISSNKVGWIIFIHFINLKECPHIIINIINVQSIPKGKTTKTFFIINMKEKNPPEERCSEYAVIWINQCLVYHLFWLGRYSRYMYIVDWIHYHDTWDVIHITIHGNSIITWKTVLKLLNLSTFFHYISNEHCTIDK